jgi:uncharacterized protein (DUF305 family)
MKRAFAALGLIVSLSACEGGGDPVQQALRDTAAANHAATVTDGAVSTMDHAAMDHGDAPGDRAFAASEAAMHAGMSAASGATVDAAYIAKMIEHHRGAVAMAEVALAESQDPDIRRMAQAVKDAQTREITEMRAWRPAPAN